eukprot:gene6349-7001_t
MDANQRYDRQIRVWGKEAQGRLVSSRVLLCGFRSLNVEVAKNLVLAGVQVTIQDDEDLRASDYGINFFLSSSSSPMKVTKASLPALQALNTYSEISSVEKPLEEIGDDFFASFDVIVYCGDREDRALRLDRLVRRHEATTTTTTTTTAFFWAQAQGEEALFFADLGDRFEFSPDPSPSSVNASSSAPKRQQQSIHSPSLEELLAVRWADLRGGRRGALSKAFLSNRLLSMLRIRLGRALRVEDAPALLALLKEEAQQQGLSQEEVEQIVGPALHLLHRAQAQSLVACSVLGSFLSQEVIKAVTHVGQPAGSILVFSAEEVVVRALPLPKTTAPPTATLSSSVVVADPIEL